jgi:CheY-like chemotaxis protein
MPTAAPALLTTSTAHPQGRRVLVVDDDRAIRDLFRAVLRRADFIVEVADSGTAALRRVAESGPDVVTLDLAMPGVDGFAVIDRIRALSSPPPIVVVSGGAYPERCCRSVVLS